MKTVYRKDKTALQALFILFVLFGIVSCENRVDKMPIDYDKHGFSVDKVELRGSSEIHERFLGRSFNLLTHSFYDEEGFSRTLILDMNSISNGTPWDPFSQGTDLSAILAPEIVNEKLIRDPIFRGAENVSGVYMLDSLIIKGGAEFDAGSVRLAYNSTSERDEKKHIFRAYNSKPERVVSFSIDDTSFLNYFLSRRFVRHLSSMSASDLVDRYGTHLVTSYTLGAYSELVVKAKSGVFTDEEMASITASYSGANVSADIYRKVKENKNSLFISYSQGGSDYYPSNLIGLTGLYEQGHAGSINISEWKKGLRNDDGTFMNISTIRSELISIPDLIDDIFLKVKFTCGILHKANKDIAITYILSDPKTLEPILIDGDYTFLFLRQFESTAPIRIYTGNGFSSPITDKILFRNKKSGNNWQISLEPNGLWLINYYGTDLYLCTDMVLRKKSEDNDNKRYFFFNPIPTSDLYGPKSWGNRLIKHKE